MHQEYLQEALVVQVPVADVLPFAALTRDQHITMLQKRFLFALQQMKVHSNQTLHIVFTGASLDAESSARHGGPGTAALAGMYYTLVWLGSQYTANHCICSARPLKGCP